MPQSLSRVWLHVVFSTKQRRQFLQCSTFREQMFQMLSYYVRDTGCVSASVGGHVDHVHLLVGATRTITIAKLLEHVKTKTSHWARNVDVGDRTFRWQNGYGVFSVSQSMKEGVDQYIRHQDAHHEKQSYRDEFRRLCRRHDLECDERFAWD